MDKETRDRKHGLFQCHILCSRALIPNINRTR